ncbi:MAG: AzlC family ABC transporter permease [Chloroflexota bacterium]|nr:AzlC family ABC transporter permease [Chloroflexota bacterium]
MIDSPPLSAATDAPALAPSTPRAEFIAGMKATIPLIIGAIPFGIIFGALAVAGGLPPALPLALSALVYAGAAQFIAIGLLASGASIPVIVLTTFVVNLRHALYAATLAPYMKHLPQRWLVPLGFWLTDETFVVAIQRYQDEKPSPHKHWYYFGSALSMYVNWQLCTLVGVIAGGAIPDPRSWGLDFAMSVTFIGMVVPMIKNRPALVSVVVASAAAIAFHGLPSQLGLLVAAVCGVAAGVLAERALTPKTQT